MIRVYEVKRHCFSLYMALCIPLPSMAVNLPCLTGSLSQLPSFGISIIRVSAQLLYRVMPSGIYSCRLLAHSLYVLLLTFFLQQHFQWTFSYCIPIFILPATVAGLSIQAFFTQMLKPTTICCFLIFLCCHYCFRPYDITQHLLTIIIYTFCQYRVEDPDQLARNRYD